MRSFLAWLTDILRGERCHACDNRARDAVHHYAHECPGVLR